MLLGYFSTLTSLFLFSSLHAGRYYPQIEDFLCGCAYCETINPGEPLDIGYHMLRCHVWRKSMLKTVKMMEQNKPNPHDIPVQDTLPKPPTRQPQNDPIVVEPELTVIDDPYRDYKWRYTEDHGWTYSTTHQHNTTDDTWLYREDIGWVYNFNSSPGFLYSEEHGWFYSMHYYTRNILYWYDRKYWLLAHDFWWKR